MSATPTFYILHGDDSISRDAALARMREAMDEDGGLNRSEFDGAQVSVQPRCWRRSRSLPFLAEKRLVIVKGLISHVTRKRAEAEPADCRAAKLAGFCALGLL